MVGRWRRKHVALMLPQANSEAHLPSHSTSFGFMNPLWSFEFARKTHCIAESRISSNCNLCMAKDIYKTTEIVERAKIQLYTLDLEYLRSYLDSSITRMPCINIMQYSPDPSKAANAKPSSHQKHRGFANHQRLKSCWNLRIPWSCPLSHFGACAWAPLSFHSVM
jgi:hypothetical protein